MVSIRVILVSLVLIVESAWAAQVTFTNSHLQVLGSLDLIRFLHNKFRFNEGAYSQDDYCEELDYSKHIILGSFMPEKEARMVEKPEPSFVEWYLRCIDSFATRKLAWEESLYWDQNVFERTRDSVKAFLGDDLWKWLEQRAVKTHLQLSGGSSSGVTAFNWADAMGVQWKLLPGQLRSQWVKHLIHYLIGTDEIVKGIGWIGKGSVVSGHPETLEQLVQTIVRRLDRVEKKDEKLTVKGAIILVTKDLLGNGEVLTN